MACVASNETAYVSLLSVVEDYSEGVATSGAKTTHAVPQVHAIHTFLTVDRTITNSKYNSITLSQRHDYGARLHAWPLLRHHEFAACEILMRFRQQDRELEREYVFAI